MVLPRYQSSMVVVDNVDFSGINITDLLGKHFEERVMAMIELFASALWRSSQEFLGEYFTIWNQIGCLTDPAMCHKIAFVLQKALSSKNLEETKRLVVESFRDQNLRFKDLDSVMNMVFQSIVGVIIFSLDNANFGGIKLLSYRQTQQHYFHMLTPVMQTLNLYAIFFWIQNLL